MHILYVSDGKAGHRSQALGLYRAIERQSVHKVSFEEISIEQLPLISLFLSVLKKQSPFLKQTPNYIVGVGSHTQLRVLLLGKIYPKAKTVILMKPNYPYIWFDYVVVPQHDGLAKRNNIILTQGALNPIVNEQRHQTDRILMALGGTSKRHQWNEQKVLTAIHDIVEYKPASEIILTTSRRTPAEFIDILRQQSFAQHLQIFPVEQTPQGWIFEEMQKAEAVWVTEDSVSMVFEALTAGCRVGVIAIDRLKDDRITHSIDQMIESQLISQNTCVVQLPQPYAFKEADRVATYLLAK
ncbi:mitochondrial fission ELM1 family protein [Acinetobacter radioresistens]|uniref:mitochondrial fission ELM1 family protein n=1 Tax=Acinetobacter radioresistens TaxID=40216 RepID=UPI000D0B4BC0|nr:ELM1/GtrOC1 family putative glycosyltransferase [Acinetobacter radioresistens]PSD39633.1 nucleoside-diphosphate sugar epimerase [Acinetobacter radioresistens]